MLFWIEERSNFYGYQLFECSFEPNLYSIYLFCLFGYDIIISTKWIYSDCPSFYIFSNCHMVQISALMRLIFGFAYPGLLDSLWLRCWSNMKFISETVKDTWARIALLRWIANFIEESPYHVLPRVFYLSGIVVIIKRASCCLLYVYVMYMNHRSGDSMLNFTIVNFHVTAAFQIHCFCFLKCLFKTFCVRWPPSFLLTFLSVAFFIWQFFIRWVTCSIMFVFLIEKISGRTTFKQKFVCMELNLK